VIITMAAPVGLLGRPSTARIWAWMVTSRAWWLVGDDHVGVVAMAMAIMTRWRMPPENSWGKPRYRSERLGIPTIWLDRRGRGTVSPPCGGWSYALAP